MLVSAWYIGAWCCLFRNAGRPDHCLLRALARGTDFEEPGCFEARFITEAPHCCNRGWDRSRSALRSPSPSPLGLSVPGFPSAPLDQQFRSDLYIYTLSVRSVYIHFRPDLNICTFGQIRIYIYIHFRSDLYIYIHFRPDLYTYTFGQICIYIYTHSVRSV